MPGSRPSGPGLRRGLVVLLALGTSALALPGVAQEDGGQQALVRAQSLLRQVSGQKQELEAANARLTAEVESLKRKLAAAEGGLREASLSLASEQRKLARAEGVAERLERTEAALRGTDGELRQAVGRLRVQEQAALALQGRLAEVESALADSERKNLQLYQANLELLELYRRKGPLTALLQKDPLTGLKDVEIQNVLQEYRVKLDESLAEGNGSTAGPAPGGDPTP